MNNISNLSFSINYKVYTFLPHEDKKSLSFTCKHFYRFIKQTSLSEQFAKKVTAFILENCQIIESSLPISELKLFHFYTVSLLGLGEIHSKNEHRYLNAKLIHLCWRIHSTLFVEGDQNSFAYFSRIGKGQFTYLNQSIVAHSRIWDISGNEEYNHLILSTLSFVKSTFRIAQDMLNLPFEENNFSLNLYLTYIHRHFDQAQHQELYQRFPFLKDVKNRFKSEFKEAFLRELKYITICIILIKQNALSFAYDQELKKFCELRNKSLVNNFYKSLFIQQNCSIYVTGQGHLKNKAVIAQTRSLHRRYKEWYPGALNDAAPILFLAPLSSVTKSSIDSSYHKHFGTITDAKNEMLQSGEKEAPPEELDAIEFINKRIRSGDCKTFDADENHFGQWLEYSFIFLNYERNQLFHQISLAPFYH